MWACWVATLFFITKFKETPPSISLFQLSFSQPTLYLYHTIVRSELTLQPGEIDAVLVQAIFEQVY